MATINQLLNVIPYGKGNAIHAEDIARQLQLPTGGNQVEARGLIRDAIQNGQYLGIGGLTTNKKSKTTFSL